MQLVIDFLENKINLTKEDGVVIGVSAGPDSMCLLYLLEKLEKKIGFKIIVAHINHQKRKESEEEEEFLRNYCHEHNIIFESMRIEEYKNGNFHQEAREIRYKFYKDLIDKYNASYLMTAHHGDDLIETILMRLVRGSTLNGYKGIPLITNMETYWIVRPLLYVTKTDILNFLEANNIPYRIDKSNFSDKYTRNRYRKNVLPFLKEEEKNVHLKFLKFGNTINECNNYIEKVLDNAYNNTYKDRKLDILLFKQLDTYIGKCLIEKILGSLYSDLSNIKSKHIDLILNLIKKNKSGSELNLPNNIKVLIEYNYLYFETNKEVLKDYCFELKNGLKLLNGFSFFEYDGNDNGNDTLHLSSSDIKLPLYVRNKRNGDRIELKGVEGSKKVSDIFIDKKIKKEERVSYPVVVDSNGLVVWIPKLKKSKYDSQNKEKCDIIFKCL